MAQPDIKISSNSRPAARGALAAAGPVEPSASPDVAPGPILSDPAQISRADYFHRRKTEALVTQGRTLFRRGENYSSIARALAITPDTARRWLDPEYDARRRRRTAQLATGTEEATADDANLPTLPFIPGLIICGRYRMKYP